MHNVQCRLVEADAWNDNMNTMSTSVEIAEEYKVMLGNESELANIVRVRLVQQNDSIYVISLKMKISFKSLSEINVIKRRQHNEKKHCIMDTIALNFNCSLWRHDGEP